VERTLLSAAVDIDFDSHPEEKQRVPLDKSEGGVKDKSILSVFLAPLFVREG
jgi:hypothetical protein